MVCVFKNGIRCKNLVEKYYIIFFEKNKNFSPLCTGSIVIIYMMNDKNTGETMHYESDKGEIILYQPDNSIKLEVWLRDETVWLSQAQMAELFQTTRNNITMHISNLFKEGELDGFVVCKDFLHTTQHGAIAGKTQVKSLKLYNLDVIISVGYLRKLFLIFKLSTHCGDNLKTNCCITDATIQTQKTK